MLDALRQCEPEMPVLIGNSDGSNANITKDFFTQSTILGVQQQATILNNSNCLVEDNISSTSPPSLTPVASLQSAKANTVVHTLAELYDRELVNTIGWAKQIPGMY